MRNELLEENFGRQWFVAALGRNCRGAGPKQRITPEVRAWIDSVFIPAMLRQYLANPALAEDDGGSTMEHVQ
jgi:hypothetical protein